MEHLNIANRLKNVNLCPAFAPRSCASALPHAGIPIFSGPLGATFGSESAPAAVT